MTETKISCVICNEWFNSNWALTKHLKKVHNISRKEYYDTYIEPGFHKCPFCQNERKWYLTSYRNTCCSKECNFKFHEMRIKEIYGVDNISQCQMIKDKKVKTCQDHYGCSNPSQSKEIQLKKEYTCEHHFGVKHPLQSKEIKENWIITNNELYGCDFPVQNEEVKQKIKNTCIRQYGYEYASQSDIVKDKMRQTNIERRGVPYPMMDSTVKEKSIHTCMEKYGVQNGGGSTESISKIKQTKLERYQDENYCNVEKIKETFIEHYGCHPMQVDEIKQRIVDTNRTLYGVDYYTQSIQYHKNKKHKFESSKYPGNWFDSTWEVKVYDFCKDQGIDVEYQPNISIQYEYDELIWTYHPDFLINDRLFEVKGNHFFRINESTGQEEMYCPFKKSEWTDGDYKWQCGKFDAKYKCMITNGIVILRQKEIDNLSIEIFNIDTPLQTK